jgi:FlaA1/EpsC-like NDP-sugar epimerase
MMSEDHNSLQPHLRGKTVLISGAAGSIGSELCHQIAASHRMSIVAFDIAESPLFLLGLEISRHFPECAFRPEIGNIRDPARVREVFKAHRPSVVYHAAAYKHVPLMESHPFEAVGNNVFGTWNLAAIAREFDVETFFMISSDKAVRPASIMGATKRIAELIVQACEYTSVRFGNVLGSSGSVIPVLREQIARGGPVTVTDPEMRRYFVTASEACRLVIEASATARHSEILTLDMGDPVKITDLTNDLIRLSGLQPNLDIQIEFTHPRPGEKISEELTGPGETLMLTTHPRIFSVAGEVISKWRLERVLEILRAAYVKANLRATVSAIQELVPDYVPGETICRRLGALPDCAAEGGVSRVRRNPLSNPKLTKTPITGITDVRSDTKSRLRAWLGSRDRSSEAARAARETRNVVSRHGHI